MDGLQEAFSGEQARHGGGFTKGDVLDGAHFNLEPLNGAQGLHGFLEHRGEQGARAEDHLGGGHRGGQFGQWPRQEIADHADTVFQHWEALISVFGRQGPTGNHVELVRGEDKARAAFTQELLLPNMGATQHVLGLSGRVRAQFREVAAVPGQPDRHAGHGLHVGQAGEVLEAVVQVIAVVASRQEHELRVQINRLEAGQGVLDFGGFGVFDLQTPPFHHVGAQGLVGGVDADVQRREVLAQNPVKICFGQVGQGHK